MIELDLLIIRRKLAWSGIDLKSFVVPVIIVVKLSFWLHFSGYVKEVNF